MAMPTPAGRAAYSARRSASTVGAGPRAPAVPETDGPAGWVGAAQAGDESAFAALYLDTQPRLLGYAIGLVGADAEDVTAEAWLQIARDLPRFAGDLDAFRGWAARIVRNRAIDSVRARSRRPVQSTGLIAMPDQPTGQDAAELALTNLATDSAIALIARLPRDQAEAVLLRVVVGLDASAAGQVLGKRAGAVRVAAHRGLRSLARLLAERADE
jgi:RNA polymerase sigma-70 factor (ECF subfamily)